MNHSTAVPLFARDDAPDEPRHESLRTSRGNLGMWVFLGSEVVTFGGLIATYLLLRVAHPEWLEHSSHTLLWVGATNTVVLLTSSLTMVLAHAASIRGEVRATRRFLLMTLVFGAIFLGLKAYEYSHEIHAGLIPSKAVFWGFYYAMTGLHALHVIAGLVVMVYLQVVVGNPTNLRKVTPVGLYWHFVDIVWIFLFPLLYVTTH